MPKGWENYDTAHLDFIERYLLSPINFLSPPKALEVYDSRVSSSASSFAVGERGASIFEFVYLG